jgi:3',5'-cyclic AMP phosphodiesterase CpdA
VLREQTARKETLLLLDPEGYVYPIPGPREMPQIADPLGRAVAQAARLQARHAATLAADPPDDDRLAALLKETPENTNLRLLRAARVLASSEVDAVLITGDLTDDGFGYELIPAAFRRYAERGRLLAIPGNHDLYLFPIASSGRPRPTHASKREAWRAFAAGLGLDLDESGAWVRAFPEGDLVVVGLDSCARGQPRFYRHNGSIGPAQLQALRRLSQESPWRDARHRVVAFHHHVVPLSHGVGRRAPTEIGMRLDDARQVAAVLSEVGATFVLHGHRHVSEERHPAGCNFRLLASPSLTLGCKSGDAPSFWRVEFDRRTHTSRVRIPVAAVEQENDPGPTRLSGGYRRAS